MAFSVVRKAFKEFSSAPAKSLKPPEPRKEEITDDCLQDIRFLFASTVDEELGLYVQRDLSRSRLNRTLQRFQFQGLSVEKKRHQVLPNIPSPQKEEEKEKVKETAPEKPAAYVSAPWRPPAAAKGSPLTDEDVGNWIAKRQQANIALDEMGLSEEWLMGKKMNPLEKRVCSRLYGGQLDAAAGQWAASDMQFRRRSSSMQGSKQDLGHVRLPSTRSSISSDELRGMGVAVLEEFLRANRWHLYHIFMKRCGIERHYLMNVPEICHLLEQAGGIVKAEDLELQFVAWKGSLAPLTAAQLRRIVANAGTDRNGLIDYRALLDDHKGKAELKRRMLRDMYRRRLLATGERTVKDVHTSIASSLAKQGDALRWIAEAESEVDSKRRAVLHDSPTPSSSRRPSASTMSPSQSHSGSQTRLHAPRPAPPPRRSSFALHHSIGAAGSFARLRPDPLVE